MRRARWRSSPRCRSRRRIRAGRAFFPSKPYFARAAVLSAQRARPRRGAPVHMPPRSFSAAQAKLAVMRAACRAISLFASPGVLSDSCENGGNAQPVRGAGYGQGDVPARAEHGVRVRVPQGALCLPHRRNEAAGQGHVSEQRAAHELGAADRVVGHARALQKARVRCRPCRCRRANIFPAGRAAAQGRASRAPRCPRPSEQASSSPLVYGTPPPNLRGFLRKLPSTPCICAMIREFARAVPVFCAFFGEIFVKRFTKSTCLDILGKREAKMVFTSFDGKQIYVRSGRT